MAEYITNGQSNYGWSLTWDAAGRYPIVAKRRFATLADAQAFVDDTSATATATEGIILSVIKDPVAKNNGVYYIESVAVAEGETGKLVKVGGAETETAADYAAAVELSKTLVVGQLIKVEGEYIENEGAEDEVRYQKGFYIVEGAGVISALATSTGADDEVGALKTRVDAVEVDVKELEEAVAAINVPVKDVTFNGESALGEDGVAAITVDLTPYETVEEADKVRGRMADAESAITALQNKDTELATAIDGKVAKEEGRSLVDDAEIAKLATVAEGAQVNVIEVVKVNGQALTVAAADKSVDVIVPSAPVQGVADGEKILSLDGDKLKTTLTLAYVSATESENAVLRLQGINGEVVSSIDATAFVKDGMLAGAKLEGPKEGETGEKYLVLSFNTDAGNEDIRMDVTDLLDYYVAGDGLTLDGNTFKVKIDETANSYLQVTTNGIAVSQAFLDKITELDNVVLAAAQGYADEKASAAQTAAQGYTDTAIADLKLDETYEKVGVAAELLSVHEEAMESVLEGKANVGDSYLKDEADAKFVAQEGFNAFAEEMEAKLEGIEENAEVNVIEAVKVNGVEATITEKVAEVTIDGNVILVGEDIEGTVKNEETGEITTEVIYQKNTSLADVLQGIQDSVSVAVSGGLSSVVPGNGIEVSAVVANKQTVSVKVSAAEGNMITADENGIYAAMYYDGDDAE